MKTGRPSTRGVEDASPRWLARHGALLAVCAVLALVALVRLRVADVPIERDEGEYAYAGQLILQGVPPYRLAYNMKFPGTYYAYAAILGALGQTPWGIRVGLLGLNAATTLVLFFLARRLMGGVAAAVAASAFAVLALDRAVFGVYAHATHFVLLPALAGFLVLLRARDSGGLGAFVGAGALLAASVLMKQHAIVFLALGLGLALWRAPGPPAWTPRAPALRGGALLAGAAALFAVVCVVLAAQGVLGRFWFWTFGYASEYVSTVPVEAAWPLFLRRLGHATRTTRALWWLAGFGLAALWIARWKGETRVFLTGLLAASLLATMPGFYFRPHYFIVLLPAVALLAGLAVTSIERLLGRVAPRSLARVAALSVFVLIIGVYAVGERGFLFSMSARELTWRSFGPAPFAEAVEIARHIREHTTPEARVAVLGSEPEIYFHARRRSATGHIYAYPLMESRRYGAQMQDEMIGQIEAAHPDYLVLVRMATSWGIRPTSDQRIVGWAGRYARACYDLVGVADIAREGTTMRWHADATGYGPRSPNVVYTFRRKNDAPCAVGP